MAKSSSRIEDFTNVPFELSPPKAFNPTFNLYHFPEDSSFKGLQAKTYAKYY